MAPPACGSNPGVPRAEPGFALTVSAGLGGNGPSPTCLLRIKCKAISVGGDEEE